jgi:hypothetical protein
VGCPFGGDMLKKPKKKEEWKSEYKDKDGHRGLTCSILTYPHVN